MRVQTIPGVIRRQLPPHFQPGLHNNFEVAAICMIRLPT